MDSIGFIIMLVIYWIFTALAKAAKDRKQKNAGGAPAQRPRPGQQGQPQSAPEGADEIPEFLRELLGLDKPQPKGPRRDKPSTGTEELEVEAVDDPPDDDVTESWESRHHEWETRQAPPAEVEMMEGSAEADLAEHQRRLEQQIERAEAVAARVKKNAYTIKSPIYRKKTRSARRGGRGSLFRTDDELRRAIIMKEVLDRPVSKRPRRNPYWGNV